VADEALVADRALRRGGDDRLAGPFDIPVEDYVYGFTLIALTLLLWERSRLRSGSSVPSERT
jgi:hypothetical protein